MYIRAAPHRSACQILLLFKRLKYRALVACLEVSAHLSSPTYSHQTATCQLPSAPIPRPYTRPFNPNPKTYLRGKIPLSFPQNKMHDTIQVMGQRLALELVEFITPLTLSTSRTVTRLSFVGHSIGNLILRSALMQPNVAPYLPLLYLYISISGPHLGTLYTSNAVLDTGISLLKAVGRGE